MRFDGCVEPIIESALSNSRISVISSGLIKSFNFVANRLRDVCVRGLLVSLFDSSTLNNLFLDFAFLDRVFKLIYVTPALQLRLACVS
jgi:hypothetical protein